MTDRMVRLFDYCPMASYFKWRLETHTEIYGYPQAVQHHHVAEEDPK